MLILGTRLIGTPIMSLQTGGQLAITKTAIIDPATLKVEAYEVDGPLLNVKPSFIRIADVRELSDIGMIVDSSDEFIELDDVITIEKLYNLHFNLIGLSVIDEAKHKLGKVSDYSVDTSSFVVQQLTVKRGPLKGLSEAELLVHRSQIIEINDTTIKVRSTAQKLEAVGQSSGLNYLNPFRHAPAPVDNHKGTN